MRTLASVYDLKRNAWLSQNVFIYLFIYFFPTDENKNINWSTPVFKCPVDFISSIGNGSFFYCMQWPYTHDILSYRSRPVTQETAVGDIDRQAVVVCWRYFVQHIPAIVTHNFFREWYQINGVICRRKFRRLSFYLDLLELCVSKIIIKKKKKKNEKASFFSEAIGKIFVAVGTPEA